ncbi:hypothetical protein FJ945_19605 [Mesorhizobium sp. B2-4-9]|nr:hypothetical protein FJ945_19605 [Mesorhizobium sp. B2-4-9]
MARTKLSKQLSRDEIERFLRAAEGLHKRKRLLPAPFLRNRNEMASLVREHLFYEFNRSVGVAFRNNVLFAHHSVPPWREESM